MSGVADFSVYDPTDRTIAERRTYGGCQPYFSHDGRWGYWAAGTGGPLNRIELETGRVSTILSKSDPRIPDGLGYAYFPMFSRDGRLFAFAASDYQHNHFLADYEIFVAPSDPETLELLGDAVRMTSDPATDRFPDVFLEPLPLGRLQGEAPYHRRIPTRGRDRDHDLGIRGWSLRGGFRGRAHLHPGRKLPSHGAGSGSAQRPTPRTGAGQRRGGAEPDQCSPA